MTDLTLSDLRDSWERSLKADNKSKKTQMAYLGALDKLVAYTNDMPVALVTKADIEAFVVDALEHKRPASVSVYYRGLQQFFKWAEADGELPQGDPMRQTKPPIVPEDLAPVLSEETVLRLQEACRGNGFEDRRDFAIVWLFRTSAVRLAEVTSMKTSTLWIGDRRASVLGKGRRERLIRFDLQTANAIERYMRVRRRHRLSDLPDVWIGDRGALTANGLYQAIKRRARTAGVTLHPHLFRHTFAHNYLAGGGNESDLMALAGWKSAQMLRRYGASAAQERALANYDKVMLKR